MLCLINCTDENCSNIVYSYPVLFTVEISKTFPVYYKVSVVLASAIKEMKAGFSTKRSVSLNEADCISKQQDHVNAFKRIRDFLEKVKFSHLALVFLILMIQGALYAKDEFRFFSKHEILGRLVQYHMTQTMCSKIFI